MRAVRFDAFGSALYVAEVEEPTPPPRGVVIEVRATGICRSDWHGWQGHDPDIVSLPHVPGHEFAGVITDLGPGTREWSIGDRVTVPFVCGCGACATCLSGDPQVCPHQWQPGFSGPGSFAERVAIPFADANLVRLPDDLPDVTAAALGCRFATAYRAVCQVAQVRAGEVVVVFGCGGVGLSAVMISAARGATVVAVDIHAAALDRAVSAGAAHVVDGADDPATAIRDLLGGGADVSIDALGSPATAAAAVRSLRPRGRHVQVGLLPPAVVRGQETIPMHTVISRELVILGSHGMAASGYPEMLDLIARGALRPTELVTGTITLDEVPGALSSMASSDVAGMTVCVP